MIKKLILYLTIYMKNNFYIQNRLFKILAGVLKPQFKEFLIDFS